MKRILVLVLLLAASLPVLAQKQPFYPEDALREFQIEAGASKINAAFLQVNYTQLFYKRLAWRAGGQFVLNPDGYEYMLGVPLAIMYRSETATTGQALDNALTVSYDPDPYYYYERDNLAGSILLSALAFLIRRIDVYAGITPGYYLGPADVAPELRPYGRFFLSADAGLSLSIPIWRFTLSATPSLHYALLGVRSPNEGYNHLYFSMSFGLGYLF
jgi:hypothetical protein